jgi:Acyl-CoA thioesterase C-terminal domain/Acyl-CoA thioesterase N-terminal domain
VSHAFYEILEEQVDGTYRGRFRSTDLTLGPWAPGLQHAGPPSALLTRSVGLLPDLPPDPLPARLSFDIHAPVPVAELVLTARTLRRGRRVALVEATLAAAHEVDRPLMTLRAWLLRQMGPDVGATAGLPSTPSAPAPPRPEGARPMARPAGWHPGYLDAIQWHWVEGSFEAPGPATVWTRMLAALVDGEDPAPIERLAAVADSASGISAVANPRDLLFVNTDLTLHITRPPVGESIWMRAATTLAPTGIGRTVGELGDAAGAVASSGQCLFVEPRR